MSEESKTNLETERPIFICHNSENACYAFALALLLEMKGLRTWLFEIDSEPGIPQQQQESDIIRKRSSAMIALMSVATVRHVDHITSELTLALEREHDDQVNGRSYCLRLYHIQIMWKSLRKMLEHNKPELLGKIGGRIVDPLNIDPAHIAKANYDLKTAGRIDHFIMKLFSTDLKTLRHGEPDAGRIDWVRSELRKRVKAARLRRILAAIISFAILSIVSSVLLHWFCGTEKGARFDRIGISIGACIQELKVWETRSLPDKPVPNAVQQTLAIAPALPMPTPITRSDEPTVHSSTTVISATNAVVLPVADPAPSIIIDSPPSAMARPDPIQYEAEVCLSKSTNIMLRDNASGGKTLKLFAGESIAIPVKIHMPGTYDVVIQYSRDSSDAPPDAIHILVDDEEKKSFQAKKTGEFGDGWNEFAVSSNSIGYLPKGTYAIRIVVGQVDQEGIEIDSILLQIEGTQGN